MIRGLATLANPCSLLVLTMNLARTRFELGEISRPEFLLQVKNSMKLVEEASSCKSCVKIERKMENGETLSEEYTNS